MSHRFRTTDGSRRQKRRNAAWLALLGGLAAISVCSGAAREGSAAAGEPLVALREVRRPEAQHRAGSPLEALSSSARPGLAGYLVAGVAGALCAYGLTRLIWSGTSRDRGPD